MTEAITTTDHDFIRRWAEQRGGRPTIIRTGAPGGILRFDFAEPDGNLDPVSWDEFFELFEQNRLAFLYQDKTADGQVSRFNKFVDRP